MNSDTSSGNAVIAVNFDITPIAAAIAANNLALANASQLGVVLTNINAILLQFVIRSKNRFHYYSLGA